MPQIDLYEYRSDYSRPTWDLPAWGHIVSKGVLPLFVEHSDRLHPVGTAFWAGRSVRFVITALHNIAEALKHDQRFERLFCSGNLPIQANLRSALYVLHQDHVSETGARFTLLPLETVDGGPPSDVVFGFPQFREGHPSLVPRLSFSPPRIGEIVWSIGYTDFEPREGIRLSHLKNFDWRKCYRHRLVVTEGAVENIFVQNFSNGFPCGPCFSFTNEICHAQSGGPVLTTDGRTVGINSAAFLSSDGRRVSLASMLYPLLLTNLRFGVSVGSKSSRIRLNAVRSLIELVMHGAVKTDGSETKVSFQELLDGSGIAIGPNINVEDHAFIFDDFSGLQDNRPAKRWEGSYWHILRDNSAKQA